MACVLITAGATRNPVDSIRYLSAHSTGATGSWIADHLSKSHSVTVLGSSEACLRITCASVVTKQYTSTRNLMALMQQWVMDNPNAAVIHAAAVGDYECPSPPQTKIESGRRELVIRLRPTPKIIDHLHQWSPNLSIFSFKAAPPNTSDTDLIAIAQQQLDHTRSAAVFANVINRLEERLLILDATGPQWYDTRQAALNALLGRVAAL